MNVFIYAKQEKSNIISIENLSKAFGANIVLRNVNLRMENEQLREKINEVKREKGL